MMASRCTFATIEAAAIETVAPVAADEGGLRGRDPRDGAGVDEHVVGGAREGEHRAAHRLEAGAVDVAPVDLLGPHLGHGEGDGLAADRLGEALPLGRGEALRVVEARQRHAVREHHRGRDDGAREGTHAHLVDAGHHERAGAAQPPAQREERGDAAALAARGREARLDASRQRAGARAGVRSQDAQQARQGAGVARRAQLLAERREGRAGRAAHGSSPSSGGAPRRRSRRRTRRSSSGSFATAATLRCQARSGTEGKP